MRICIDTVVAIVSDSAQGLLLYVINYPYTLHIAFMEVIKKKKNINPKTNPKIIMPQRCTGHCLTKCFIYSYASKYADVHLGIW